MVLLQRKPLAGMDLLAALGRQIHAAQQLVRSRSARNPNEVIEEQATFGNRVADAVARFGGSWSFILSCLGFLAVYVCINVGSAHSAWDPYPFILLNLFLSMLAAIQAPIIMMSQNRQDAKDRVRSELDYEVNRRAAADIQGLARKINLLGEPDQRFRGPNPRQANRKVRAVERSGVGMSANKEGFAPGTLWECSSNWGSLHVCRRRNKKLGNEY